MIRSTSLLVLVALARSGSAQAPMTPPDLRLPHTVEPLGVKASLRLQPGHDGFEGRIVISVNVLKPTSVIWLNARSLQFQSGEVQTGGGRQSAHLQTVGEDFVAISTDHSIPAGPAQIEIHYTGEVSRTLTDGAFQQQRGDDWYIFTKFEPVTARRVFPCFDEPSYKVPWQLTLTYPKGLHGYSNTPAAATKEDADDMATTQFEQTKPLPSYLVAFAIGPFDEVATEPIGRNHVPGHIIVPRGRGAEAHYAASVAPQLISLLENYFGRPYPYSKLDQIVVPVTTAWGAMENAGLIAYGDFLLSPPSQETELWRSGRAGVMEHEMAHQWFGDLVTMAWWDDLWLNEAFASWIESKLLNEWKPEWNIKANEARLSSIFEFDTMSTARKIRQPIEKPGDIANAFDGITYQKGERIIGMFENYVGADAFEQAVQMYLSKHEWGNATSNDLLSAIDQVAPDKHAGSAFQTFLNEVGFPLLTVAQKCHPDGSASLDVSQKRFLPTGSHAPQESWAVPVCSVWGNDSGTHRQCDLLTKSADVFSLRGASGCPAWLSADSGASGYYAVEYESKAAAALTHSRLEQLSAAERAALLRNTELLFSSGIGDLEQDLTSASEFSRSNDQGLVRQSAHLVLSVERFVPSDSEMRYSKWIRDLYEAKAHTLGWKPAAGESNEIRLLRMTIVPLVAVHGQDAQLQQQSTVLAQQWLKEKSGLDPDMVSLVLGTAAWDGNREFFDQLVDAIRHDNVQRERAWMIGALANFRNPELAEAGLELLFQPGIDPRELQRNLFGANEYTRETVWSFIKKNFDRLNSLLPSARNKPFGAILPSAASDFCDANHASDVEAFFAPRLAALPGGARNVANAVESIKLCAARADVTRAAVKQVLEKY